MSLIPNLSLFPQSFTNPHCLTTPQSPSPDLYSQPPFPNLSELSFTRSPSGEGADQGREGHRPLRLRTVPVPHPGVSDEGRAGSCPRTRLPPYGRCVGRDRRQVFIGVQESIERERGADNAALTIKILISEYRPCFRNLIDTHLPVSLSRCWRVQPLRETNETECRDKNQYFRSYEYTSTNISLFSVHIQIPVS